MRCDATERVSRNQESSRGIILLLRPFDRFASYWISKFAFRLTLILEGGSEEERETERGKRFTSKFVFVTR